MRYDDKWYPYDSSGWKTCERCTFRSRPRRKEDTTWLAIDESRNLSSSRTMQPLFTRLHRVLLMLLR